MNRLCKLVLASAVVLSFGVNAAETGPVREFYACNFREGKGIDDLMAIRDVIVEQIEKTSDSDLSNMVSLLWTPVKTNQQLDFLWFDMHENMNAMGRASDAFASSGGRAVIDALAAETVECRAGIVTHEAIYTGSGELGQGSVLVESFVCELHPGKTVADARKAVEYWQDQVKDLGMYETYVAYMQTPVISASSADLYYFGVHNNMTDYAARTSAFSTSEGGIEANRRFDEVHRCQSALWSGQVVVGTLE